VPGQITVLLALAAKLFDPVPLDQMTDAENALLEAADIPAEVSGRLNTAEELSDEDRKMIIQIATKSLARFQPKPASPASAPESKPKVKARSKPDPKQKAEIQTDAKPDPEVQTEAEPKPSHKLQTDIKRKLESEPEKKS
jgi:F-type H+-transporting ATPase subunit alpha